MSLAALFGSFMLAIIATLLIVAAWIAPHWSTAGNLLVTAIILGFWTFVQAAIIMESK